MMNVSLKHISICFKPLQYVAVQEGTTENVFTLHTFRDELIKVYNVMI